MKKEDLLWKIINQYGNLSEIGKSALKCSALATSLIKYITLVHTTNNAKVLSDLKILKVEIEEEVANTEIMIEELKLILNLQPAVTRFKKIKLARLKELLNQFSSETQSATTITVENVPDPKSATLPTSDSSNINLTESISESESSLNKLNPQHDLDHNHDNPNL